MATNIEPGSKPHVYADTRPLADGLSDPDDNEPKIEASNSKKDPGVRPVMRRGKANHLFPGPGEGSSYSSMDSTYSSAPSSMATTCTEDIEKEVETGNKTTDLTVQNKSKIEAEFKPNDHQHASSVLTSIMKWITLVFVSLSFLASLVASKISLIELAKHMENRSNISDTRPIRPIDTKSGPVGEYTYGAESTFLMLLITVMIPYALTLIRSLWCGAWRSDRPWPAWSAFLWGLIASLLESIGIVLFAFGVLASSKGYIGVLLMNGVFLVHILSYIIKYLKKPVPHRKCLLVCFILALVLELGGLVSAGIFEVKIRSIMDRNIYVLPLSLICLAIAFCPPVQKRQLYPRTKGLKMKKRKLIKFSEIVKRPGNLGPSDLERCRRYLMDGGETSESGDGSEYGSITSAANLEGAQRNGANVAETQSRSVMRVSDMILNNPQLSARWKSTVITTIWKLIFIPSFAMLFVWYFEYVQVTNLQAGILNVSLQHPMFYQFLCSIFSSFFGYIIGWIACILCMQKIGFALPLTLATPMTLITLLIMSVSDIDCHLGCQFDGNYWYFAAIAAACLYVAQIMSTSYFIFKTETIIMQKESTIFWLPGYNSVFLEQWLLLTKKNKQNDASADDIKERVNKSRVFICTTMYREAAHEMEQLLQSIAQINRAKQESGRFFQSHVFFDNGVRQTKPTEFALQLVSLVEQTLGVKSEDCTKTFTPYGMRLAWKLPEIVHGKEGMIFTIHLKDNLKVKNKKRWSQVMYMSYVLDYHMREDDEATDEDTFILTTDADVKFSPESVEALLDFMSRDANVGAVCARTFPMGSGPIYWYQIFDYAIGHWFQKAANHVLGSVLCCPGCFSVYRAEALRNVLPTYASGVTKASEFLTKDMGEDRWLCTLLVQSGWRLEYCAASDNSTYCPEEFDEFFKQRRRWIPSTLANLALLVQEWKVVSFFNKQISFLFLLYQSMLLFSTLITPGMCLLIISGGLYYAWNFDQVASMVILLLITVGYTVVCLNASQDVQLNVARLLTVFFALVMAAVIIGTAVQIVEEQKQTNDTMSTTTAKPKTTTTTPAPKPTNGLLWMADETPGGLLPNDYEYDSDGSVTPTKSPIPLPISVTTLYLASVAGMFVIAGLMHLPEVYCLVHGVWYLLCLPSGYLILIIYSICNMTDRSWGTREEKTVDIIAKTTWQEDLLIFWKRMFFCFIKEDIDESPPTFSKGVQAGASSGINKRASVETEDTGPKHGDEVEEEGAAAMHTKSITSLERSGSFSFHHASHEDGSVAVKIHDWLPSHFKDMYGPKFEKNGYEDTTFIAGMTDGDLKNIGINTKGHRKALLDEIKVLPEPELEPFVPERVEDWLYAIGLSKYYPNFRTVAIIGRKNMEILKSMSLADIKKELRITKIGHLKRLCMAIKKLRYPTETEIYLTKVKKDIDSLPIHNLENVNGREHDFWEKLRKERLKPDSAAFATDLELKEKLTGLRNSTLMVFAVTNALWIILIMTLVTKSDLNVLGTNVLGLVFLAAFAFILLIQFLCMIVHRFSTWLHILARAPYKCGDPYTNSWSFKDSNLEKSTKEPRENEDYDDIEARQRKQALNDELRRRSRRRLRDVNRPGTSPNDSLTNPQMSIVREEDERQPLLQN